MVNCNGNEALVTIEQGHIKSPPGLTLKLNNVLVFETMTRSACFFKIFE